MKLPIFLAALLCAAGPAMAAEPLDLIPLGAGTMKTWIKPDYLESQRPLKPGDLLEVTGTGSLRLLTPIDLSQPLVGRVPLSQVRCRAYVGLNPNAQEEIWAAHMEGDTAVCDERDRPSVQHAFDLAAPPQDQR